MHLRLQRGDPGLEPLVHGVDVLDRLRPEELSHPDVVLIGVHVQLRLSRIGVAVGAVEDLELF